MNNLKQKLRKLTKLAARTKDRNIIKAVAKLTPNTNVSWTVPAIPDTALERAIKTCVKFSDSHCQCAQTAVNLGDDAFRHIELARTGLVLINNLAELISEA